MTDDRRNQLLTCAFALGLMFLLSLPWQPYTGDFAIKGGGILMLAAYAYTSRQVYRGYLVAALLFSASGDILLALDAFVPGLLSFLVAHLIYIATFVAVVREVGSYQRSRLRIAAALALITSAYLFWLWPDLGDLRAPVALYMAVITAMGAAALLAPLRSPLAVFGALAFIFSDSMIALNKFKFSFDAADPIIWVSYFAAQVLIVMGLLRETTKAAKDDPLDWESTLTNELSGAGFDLQHWFSTKSYNDRAAAGYKIDAYDHEDARALLIANSRELWSHFAEALNREPGLLTMSDPLYAYVEGAIRRAANNAKIPVDYKVHWAHAEGSDLIAIQKIADASGFARQGPMGLNIHETSGPWIGLRAVIVFDLDGSTSTTVIGGVPCETCDKPCLAPLDAAKKATDDLTSENVEAKWKLWLAVRDACPIGKEQRYSDDQIRYHYTKDRSVLDRLQRTFTNEKNSNEP